jgi:hypothetical protein
VIDVENRLLLPVSLIGFMNGPAVDEANQLVPVLMDIGSKMP